MIKTGLTVTALAVAAMSAMAYWTMQALPETGQVPVHWNINGEADRFEDVAQAKKTLWILPGLSLLSGIILAIAPRFDPRRTNLLKSSRAYLSIWIGTMILMSIVMGIVCYAMINGVNNGGATPHNMVAYLVGAISVLFIIIGNYLPKTRSSWFFGIRTPWTLSSEESWAKTHRASGRLFIIFGFVCLISIFVLKQSWLLPLLIGGSIGISIFSLIYSYLAWRNASDRTPSTDYVN